MHKQNYYKIVDKDDVDYGVSDFHINPFTDEIENIHSGFDVLLFRSYTDAQRIFTYLNENSDVYPEYDSYRLWVCNEEGDRL